MQEVRIASKESLPFDERDKPEIAFCRTDSTDVIVTPSILWCHWDYGDYEQKEEIEHEYFFYGRETFRKIPLKDWLVSI